MQIETQNFSHVFALSKLSEAVSRAPHLADIYEFALDALQNTIHADKASVLLFDETGYIDFVASRNLSEEYKQFASGHCPWKQDAINAEPILVADAEADNSLTALLPVIKKEGITALGFIPLVHKGKLLGKFMVYFEKMHHFSEEEIQIAQTIARDVAFAIWEKKSTIALQKTVQELNEIIEHSIDTIFKLDTQGCILFISPEFYRAMEYTPEDLKGQHFRKIVFEDDLHICQAAFNELVQTKTPQRSIIYRSLNKNGELRWFNTSISMVCNDTGEPQYVLGISKDITKITEADNKLKQAEESYRLFIKQSTEGIWRLKIPGGIDINTAPEEIIYYTIAHAYFEECNDAFAKMYGYKKADEIVGFKLNQLMDVNDPDNMYFFLKFINSGFNLSDGESIEFDKEGNNKIFLNNLTGIIENGKLTHIWGVQRDITKRKEDETALKESEERYKAFVRHSTEAIWRGEMRKPISCNDSMEVQLQQFYEYGYLAECNDQMAKLYGFKEAKEILGARLADFITINAELTKELSKVFIQNGYRLYRSPSIQLDVNGGKKYFLNNLVGIIEDDCVVRVWGSQTDVTEQKRAEKALQVSEQFYKSLFAESVDGAVVLNADGYIIYAAPSVTNVLGFTTDEMLGKRADDFIYTDDIKQGHTIFDNEKSGKISSKYHEIRYISKQHNIIWVKMRTYNMLENTSVNGIAVYFTDITERKKYEEELIKSELYLRGTLDSTNDGILAIDNNGKVITTNNRFTELWRIPQALIDRKDDQALLENVLDQLQHPEEFISKVNQLYKSDRTDFDTLQFKDNRVFERYTTPLMLDQNVVGRVWSFRDITESKKAEEKIKASEDQYRTMVEQASDGIFIADTTGKFIIANTSACIISGYSETELRGLTIYNLVHPECLAATPFKFEEMMQPQGARSERKMIRKNGTVLDVEISAKFLPDKRFIAFVRDITERKKVEEAIILSEEKYRTLVEQASDAIFIADINGQLITVNPSACKITQYPYEELIKKTFYDFMIKEDLESNPIRFEDLRQGKTVHIERLMKGKDGIPIHVEIISKLLSNGNMLAFVRNISDRIKAQNEIINEKNLSDSIVNGLPGVFYLFTREGKFFRWNKNFETVSGYTGEEIKNMHPLDFFDADDKELLSEKIANVFIAGEDNIQANFLLKTNEKIPYYFSGIVIQYEGMPCLMGLGIDFTEKIMVQEKIKESSEKLRQLAHHLQIVREEERKRIGREIHDELGQQLTAIKMDVAWVDKKIPEESEVIKNKLKNIIYLLDESNNSIRRILNELRPSILNDYGLLEALEWLNRQFTDKTNTPVEFTTTENSIKISEELTICIFRIYQEALTNITKYAAALKVTSTFKISDNTIEVSIADDGNGFETASLQFSKSFGIFGMKERVHSFNGNFDLVSSPGNGTKISFSLPYHIQ